MTTSHENQEYNNKERVAWQSKVLVEGQLSKYQLQRDNSIKLFTMQRQEERSLTTQRPTAKRNQKQTIWYTMPRSKKLDDQRPTAQKTAADYLVSHAKKQEAWRPKTNCTENSSRLFGTQRIRTSKVITKRLTALVYNTGKLHWN